MSFGAALKSVANFCSAAICSGLPPLPMPMNQRTTWPPFGPGPAAIGSGVTATSDGAAACEAAALGAAALGAAALGAVLVVAEPHAAATIVRTLARTSNLRGPDR